MAATPGSWTGRQSPRYDDAEGVVEDGTDVASVVDVVELPEVAVVDGPTEVVTVGPGTVVGTARACGVVAGGLVVEELGWSGELQPAGGTPLPV